jgi:hypothetical protein
MAHRFAMISTFGIGGGDFSQPKEGSLVVLINIKNS